MRNVITAAMESKNINLSDDKVNREDRNAELALEELESISAGRFTNIRANATSLIGSILPS